MGFIRDRSAPRRLLHETPSLCPRPGRHDRGLGGIKAGEQLALLGHGIDDGARIDRDLGLGRGILGLGAGQRGGQHEKGEGETGHDGTPDGVGFRHALFLPRDYGLSTARNR